MTEYVIADFPHFPIPAQLERRRMTFDEWWEIPEKVYAEYVGGEAVIAPPRDVRHQVVRSGLMTLLHQALPDATVTVGFAHRHGDDFRIPDVSVYAERPARDANWTDQAPVLLAEVVAPETWVEDLVRKPAEYLACRTGQLWLADPARRTLTVLVHAGTRWDVLLELHVENLHGEVSVGEFGTVALDLDEVFRF